MLKSTESSTETDSKMIHQLNIYPNPVGDICYIDAPSSGILSIYTINGQLIKNQHLNQGNNQLNMSELQSGLYIAKLGESVFKLKKK